MQQQGKYCSGQILEFPWHTCSEFTPAAESHGLWPWMNAPAFGRDVAPPGRKVGATGFARGAPLDRAGEVNGR